MDIVEKTSPNVEIQNMANGLKILFLSHNYVKYLSRQSIKTECDYYFCAKCLCGNSEDTIVLQTVLFVKK